MKTKKSSPAVWRTKTELSMLKPPRALKIMHCLQVQRDTCSMDNGWSSRRALLRLLNPFFPPSRGHSLPPSLPQSHHLRLSQNSASITTILNHRFEYLCCLRCLLYHDKLQKSIIFYQKSQKIIFF